MHKALLITIPLLCLVSCLHTPSEIKGTPTDLITITRLLKSSSHDKNSVLLSITDSKDENIRRLMRDNDIAHIFFYKQDEQISITFKIDIWLQWIRPKHYFKFSLNGYTEEYQVHSIRDSIAKNTHDFYHFCQKLDIQGWFYCESKD
jgi:hypothetical protein